MHAFDVRRTWQVVVSVLLGTTVLLGALSFHEAAEAVFASTQTSTASAGVVDAMPGAVLSATASEVGGGGVAEQSGWDSPSALFPGSGSEVLSHCLTALAGICLAAVVTALVMMVVRHLLGFAGDGLHRLSAVFPVGPSALTGSVVDRVSLCILRV